MHYIKNHKFSSCVDLSVVKTPDLFLVERKGTKFEHCLYLTCLLSAWVERNLLVVEQEVALDGKSVSTYNLTARAKLLSNENTNTTKQPSENKKPIMNSVVA